MPGFRGFLTAAFLVSSVLASQRAHAQEAKLYVTSSLPIVLGEAQTISLVIEVPETPESEGRPLQVTASTGRIDPPERVGAGKYRAHYHLPSTKYPQTAIIALWRETGPDARVEFLRIPLSARTKLPFKAMPGSEVRVLVGGDFFGPETADKKGNTAIPIVVPPGVREVIVETTDRASGKKRSIVPVKVPPYNKLAMAVTPYLTDGRNPVQVHVYYDDETAPPSADKVKVVVAAGSTKLLGASGNRYKFEYRAAPALTDKEVRLSVKISGDDTSGASTTLLLGTPVAEKILNRTAAGSLAANGVTTKMIRALVIDHYGLGVSGVNVKSSTSDGTIGPVRDAGGGYYEAVLTAPSAVPRGRKLTVELRADPPRGSPISANIEVAIVGGGAAVASGAQTGGTGESGAQTGLGTGSESATGTLAAGTSAAPVKKMPVFTIGARLGGAFDAQLSPLLGLELAIRPRFADSRLTFFASADFRTMSNSFSGPQLTKAESSLMRLPIFIGLTYDIFSKNDWRGYLGAGGGVVGIAHRIETDFQDPQVFRRIAPAGEVIGGVALGGLFLELGGTFMQVADRSLELPSISVSAALGYRLGLF